MSSDYEPSLTRCKSSKIFVKFEKKTFFVNKSSTSPVGVMSDRVAGVIRGLCEFSPVDPRAICTVLVQSPTVDDKSRVGHI